MYNLHKQGDQEHLEAPANPAYQQYLAQRCKEEERQEPAFLPSMASHCVQTPPQHQLYQQLGMVHQVSHHHQPG